MARFNDIQPQERIGAGRIARYMLLPEILPRLKNMGLSFHRVLFIFTQILALTGLIDKNHPGLQPETRQHYSFAGMLLTAWGNLRFRRDHLPQITMFAAVILAIVLLAGIVLAAGGYIVSNYVTPAQAQYFSAPDGTEIAYSSNEDWVHVYLERIFGGRAQTGLDFWAKDDTISAANPWYTAIFIGMLETYSRALLFIATFMILYILLSALVSAARTGKPFGEKFDSVWAPIRFIVAISLLLPVTSSGYNGAQMLVFQSAEWGSNLATNLWHKGISVDNTQQTNFIQAKAADPGYRFIRDVFLINLCVTSFNQMVSSKKLDNYKLMMDVEPTITKSGKTITYSFGNKDSPDFCGTIVMPNPDKFQDVPEDYTKAVGGGSSGFLPNTLATRYNRSLELFMPATNNVMKETTDQIVNSFFCSRDKLLTKVECANGNCTRYVGEWVYRYWDDVLGRIANSDDQNYFFATYKDDVDNYNKWLYQSIKNDARYGWATAGTFYLRMANALGLLDEVISTQPRVSKLPTNLYKRYANPKNLIDNETAEINCKEDKGSKCEEMGGAYLLSEVLHRGAYWFATAPKVTAPGVNNLDFYQQVGPQVWDASLRLPDGDATSAESVDSAFFLLSGLYNDIKISSASLHPLGQVIDWGNTLIYYAEAAFVLAMLFTVMGRIIVWAKPAFDALSNLLITLGKILIVPGFILMFVVPLLPFLYFTFAVIEWVVSIVEAVIGIPLWALSFITGQGDLLGEAKQGAKMLFEIILRPTIIVMALLSSIIVFTAAAGYFNSAMDMYISAEAQDKTGFQGLSGGIGGLGMIFIYMFTIYVLATSCFKLIDAIPNNFGRWLGLGGGFGSMIEIGASSGQIAFTSAYVANQGVDTAIGVGKTARNELYDTPTADRRNMKEYNSWVASETKRVGEYNEQARSFNESLKEHNEFRERKGLEPLQPMQYQKPPKERELEYFKYARRSGEGVKKVQGEMFSTPYAGGVAGSAMTSASSAPGGGGPGAAPTPGAGGSGPSSTGPGPGAGAPPSGGGTSPAGSGSGAPASGGGTGSSKPAGSGNAANAKMANDALDALGLPHSAGTSDIESRLRALYGSDKNKLRAAAKAIGLSENATVGQIMRLLSKLRK